MRAEGEGIIGDALVEIGPDHKDFQAWLQYLQRAGAGTGDRAPRKQRKPKGTHRP